MPSANLSDYLGEIARIRATRAGTGEISYYDALTGALNAAGERLKPRMFCVPNLRNRGSGFPDMGLFVVPRGQAPDDWPQAQPPERGVVEVDDIPADLSVKAGSAQVRRYLDAYGLVLVTNYRDFVLLGRDARGQAEAREKFSFGCDDAASFFALARSQRRPAGLGARFAEFLQRVLLQQASLARPEEVDAVRYFYELFLAAFDPGLRKKLGVWYRPREIVRYMVERVDAVLRSKLGVTDRLADPSVWVLDPCCGTGSYLVEVLA